MWKTKLGSPVDNTPSPCWLPPLQNLSKGHKKKNLFYRNVFFKMRWKRKYMENSPPPRFWTQFAIYSVLVSKKVNGILLLFFFQTQPFPWNLVFIHFYIYIHICFVIFYIYCVLKSGVNYKKYGFLNFKSFWLNDLNTELTKKAEEKKVNRFPVL